jgi:hypothetical protein
MVMEYWNCRIIRVSGGWQRSFRCRMGMCRILFGRIRDYIYRLGAFAEICGIFGFAVNTRYLTPLFFMSMKSRVRVWCW